MTRGVRSLLFALLLPLLAGCGDDSAPQPLQHGHLVRHVTVDGVEREFIVHVPDAIDGKTRVPVVVMLHGTSGDGEKFYQTSGWVEKADTEGLIAVFPSALTYCLGDDDNRNDTIEPNEWVITTKWAAGELGTPAMPLGSAAQIASFPPARQAEIDSRTVRDDVAFIDAMVRALESELPVDPKRLYVTGFSNGGSMSGRLLVERSRTFAAFALAAGTVKVEGTAERAAPCVFTFGSRDDRFTTPLGITEYPVDESLIDIPFMKLLAIDMAAAVGLDPAQYRYEPLTVRGTAIARFTFDHSLVGAHNALSMAVIDNATHQYPNGTNHPVVMADLLWTFFEANPLP